MMHSIPSTVATHETDETAYLLATLTAASFAEYEADKKRQQEEFEAAQAQQLAEFEAQKKRQDEIFAAAKAEHDIRSHVIKQRRRYALIAGLVALPVGVALYLFGAGQTVSLLIGGVGLLALAAAFFLRVGPEPSPPAPLRPPDPLRPPPPPPLPALPLLTKAYWQLALIPFGEGRSLLADTQLDQPVEIVLPKSATATIKQLISNSSELAESATLRAQAQLQQALAGEAQQYQLPLLATGIAAHEALCNALAQAQPLAEPATLDAPLLPPAALVDANQIAPAMRALAAFAEHPLDLAPAAAQSVLQETTAWVEQTTSRALSRLAPDSAANLAVNGDQPAANAPNAGSAGGAITASIQVLFDRVIQALDADVENELRQIESEAARRVAEADREFANNERAINTEYQTFLRQANEQTNNLKGQRQTIDSRLQELAQRLEQAQHERRDAENQANTAKQDLATAQTNYARIKEQHDQLEAKHRTLRQELEQLRLQTPANQEALQRATGELATRRRELSERHRAHTELQAALAKATAKLATAEKGLEDAQALTPSPSLPVQLITPRVQQAERQVATAQQETQSARQAFDAATAELHVLQNKVRQLENDIATLDKQARLLAEKEQQEQTLTTKTGSLATQLSQAGSLLQEKTTAFEQRQRKLEQIEDRGQISALEGEASRYQQELATVAANLQQLDVQQEEQKVAIDAQQAELATGRTTTKQQIDRWLQDERTRITSHIAELQARRDLLLQESQQPVLDPTSDQLDEKLLDYRREALAEQRQQCLALLEDLRRRIGTAQQQVAAYSWAVTTPIGGENLYCIPVWFAGPPGERAWTVVAAGQSYAAQPIGAGQLVNARRSDQAGALIEHLTQVKVAMRFAGFLDEHQRKLDGNQISPQLEVLERKQLIATNMRSYLQQALGTAQAE